MGKVLNFDQFMQEHERRTLDVQVRGKTYTVPMEIPAIVPVMMARAEETPGEAESTTIILRAADIMFGKKSVDEMCENGLGAKELAMLVEKLFAEINGGPEDEGQELDDESGKVQTNNRAKK